MNSLPMSRLIDRVETWVKAWRLSLHKLQATSNRKRFVDQYIAVTGSCGKTTTTRFASVLLGCYGKAAAGLENAGVRLFRDIRHLRAPVDYFVQETSGHEPGAINHSASLFRVDAAVVTSVGSDHGTRFRFPDIDIPDAIAREKGMLVEAVAPGGFACLNFDDPRVRAMASRTAERVIGFGTTADAEVRAQNVRCAWPDRLSFDLVVAGRVYPVATRFVGTIALTNLLGALSVVYGYGLPLEPAIARLSTEEPGNQRMNVVSGPDGKTYIMDAFKAPFWSTQMLIDDLPRIAIPGLIFVIGDISDMRGSSSAQYRKLVRRVAPFVDTVVLAGRSAEHAAKLAHDGVDNLVVAPTAFDVSQYLDSRPPGVVLIKSNKTTRLPLVLKQVTPQATAIVED
jgi:UDP-N-acetylmuramoyl-tripeptide--D-alanyl-D-alanine ligase